MSRNKLVRVPLFPVDVHVCTSLRAFRKAMKGYGVEPIEVSHLAGVVVSEALEKHGCVLVGVFDGKVSTLVHELFHATVHVLDYVGVPTETGKSNEPYAYVLEFLYTEFCKCPGLKIE